jgi:hypothetical protein
MLTVNWLEKLVQSAAGYLVEDHRAAQTSGCLVEPVKSASMPTLAFFFLC